MPALRLSVRAGAFVALAALVGCSGGGDKNLATVSGAVTLDGAPLDGAKVTFHGTVEVNGARGNYSAYTDGGGKYLIAQVGKDPGIPPGMYKVTVTKAEPGAKGALPPDFDAGQVEAAGGGRNTLLQEYETFATTKLSATLQTGKNENVNFELKKGKGSGTAITTVP